MNTDLNGLQCDSDESCSGADRSEESSAHLVVQPQNKLREAVGF